MIPERVKRTNVMWEITWSNGQREVVEACSLYQGNMSLGWLDKDTDETWTLYNEGRGMVWTAKKKLIDSIRCLNPEHITTDD